MQANCLRDAPAGGRWGIIIDPFRDEYRRERQAGSCRDRVSVVSCATRLVGRIGSLTCHKCDERGGVDQYSRHFVFLPRRPPLRVFWS